MTDGSLVRGSTRLDIFSLPAKFCERRHATWKIDTKRDFLSRGIRVNLKELYKSGKPQISRRTYDSHSFRADILFWLHRQQGTLGELFPHAKEADFLASDWLTFNGSRNFKLCSIHDQVYEARWFEHFVKTFRFLAIWYRTTKICSWIMSLSERELILPCFYSFFIQKVEIYTKSKTSRVAINCRFKCD